MFAGSAGGGYRDEHPELQSIDTRNADSNAHLIRVNEQLGCFVANRGSIMEVWLEPAAD